MRAKLFKPFAILAMLVCSLSASAHDFEVDGIFYKITSKADLTVEVTFKGTSSNQYIGEYLGSITIPVAVVNPKDETAYRVIGVGKSAFERCEITSITIPEGVISIGDKGFFSCKGLTSITIPEGVTSIGGNAFQGCGVLADATLPKSLTSIGGFAFYGCPSLVDVYCYAETVPEAEDKYDFSNAKYATLHVPASALTDYQNTAPWSNFGQIKALAAVSIPVSDISLNQSVLTLTVGDDFTLMATITPDDATDKTVTWTTSNSLVARVNDGMVTAVAAGSATITATAGACAATCIVTVEGAVVDPDPDPAPNPNPDPDPDPDPNPEGLASGEYYLYHADSKRFLSRGEHLGTCATVDKYGVPFVWTAEEHSLRFLDSNVCLYETGDSNLYTDNASTDFTFEAVEGGYLLKSQKSNRYLTIVGGTYCNDIVNVSDNASVAVVWQLKSKAEHDAIVAGNVEENYNNVIAAAGIAITAGEFTDYLATLTAKDKTAAIGTARFAGSAGDWAFTEVLPQICQPAYGTDFCELWQATGSYTQTITGLEEGIYKVTMQGFERAGGWAACNTLGERGYEITTATLSANGEEVSLKSWYSGKSGNNNPDNTSQAVAKFSEGEYMNEVYAYVGADGTLTIAINKSSYVYDNWVLFNNFTLTHYAVYDWSFDETTGHLIVARDFNLDTANEYPWYAFRDRVKSLEIGKNVTLIGDYAFCEYRNLSSITFSEDSQLASIGEGAFWGCSSLTSVTLPKGVTEIGNFAFWGCSSLTSVTLPESITSIGIYVFEYCPSLTVVTSLAMSVPQSKEVGIVFSEYVGVIDVLYYPYGSDYSSWAHYFKRTEAIGIPENIPMSGEYYLCHAESKRFLSRGEHWGTCATVDKYGIPFVWTAEEHSLRFLDSNMCLYETDDSNLYTDKNSTGFVLEAVEGGYLLKSQKSNRYLTIVDAAYSLDIVTVTDDTSAAVVWQPKSKAERDAIVAGYVEENYNNVIAASGVTTTAGNFASYLETLATEDMTSAIGTARFEDIWFNDPGEWTYVGISGLPPSYGADFCKMWEATGYHTQTITDLPEGIYKVTVQGFERAGGWDECDSLGERGYEITTATLSANGEEVNLKSWYSGKSDDNNPNSTDEAVAKFTEGKYMNEVYTYVGADGILTITVNKPSHVGDSWVVFNNFTLTHYVKPPQPEGLLTDKNYRVKNVSTGLYLQVSGNNTNMKLQNKAEGVELSQVFQLVDAGEGVYYIRAADSDNNYYAHASKWNFNATNDVINKTPFTIALVEGETNMYTLNQSASSYAGSAGSDASEAGADVYCDKSVDNNGKWVFEPLTEEENAAYIAVLAPIAKAALDAAIARGENIVSSRSAVLTASEKTAIRTAVQAAKEGRDVATEVATLQTLSDAIHAAVDAAIYVWSIEDLNGAICYAVSTEDRGAWCAQNGRLYSTTKAGVAVDVADAKQRFAFVQSPSTGAYYLYSVSEEMFVKKDGNYTLLTEVPVQTITFLEGACSVSFPWVVALNTEEGEMQMSISNDHEYGIITHWNNLRDIGNAVRFEKVAAFDASAALDAIDAYENPIIDVVSVVLSKTSVTLTEGENLTLTATISPDDATDKVITWSSSKENVATVKNGVITAKAAGKTTITAQAGGKKATCEVTVKKKVVAVSRVTLNESLLSLEVGKTFTLIATITPDNATDKSVVWSSSDESIAAVKNGVVTAKVAGTAIITAAAGDEEATCVVTVVNPASVNTPVVVNGKLIVYDLIGRKMQVEHLDELPVGVYVINGQKVVIK